MSESLKAGSLNGRPWWLSEFSAQYFIDLTDYGPQGRGDWLLIGSGAGIMMAVMDAAPRLRWCVDIDSLRRTDRFARWLAWAENFVGGIAIAGWFSITDPAMLIEAVKGLKKKPLCYTQMADVGGERVETLGELIEHLNVRIDDGIQNYSAVGAFARIEAGHVFFPAPVDE
jgi:hypothetical protein